ncbi:hypothetical protein [Vibrio coralliirubri]|uniref:hypothetical protein n=1 Tax=Vibrio coralliirubri TaxID=1516159 RepID=UPI00062EA170|nr:hypothetical protein [Vibrio coralliirubri]CDT81768.1 hypothetical protein VCR29J2_680095 [Vibrio coralliirubri]
MKFLGYITVFFLGALIEATDYTFLVKGVAWTDLIVAISTVVTAFIVYITYSKWLTSKKKEDAYQTSKDYISCLVAISELLGDLFEPISTAVPQAGSIPIDSNYSLELLASSNKAHQNLVKSYRTLERTKRELGFWGVSLTKEFSKTHIELMKQLHGAIVISSVVQTKIYQHYNLDSDNLESMVNEFNKLQDRVQSSHELLSKRYDNRYEDFFIHKK